MQNIALQITLNGVPQAVSSIKELETAINQARTSLYDTTIPGSEQFKKLSAEIGQAESKLKDLKKASEGKDTEAFLGDLGKLGGAIAGSFAAATAAVSLFGAENEDVTKAVTQAQNLLTLALGARSAAEGLVVVRTLATNIATKALTASTNAANATTKAFYATLAANPYGAIIAAVGVLVTALVLLNKEQSESEIQAEKAAEAQKKYQEAIKNAGTSAKLTANQVGFLFEEFKAGRLTLEQFEPFVRKFATALQNVNLETEEGQKTLREYLTNLADLAIIQDRLAAKQTEYTDAVNNGNEERQRAIRKEIEQLSIQAARYTSFIVKAEEEDKKRGEEREKRLNAAAEAQKKRDKALLESLIARVKSENEIIGSNTAIIETEVSLIDKLQKKVDLLEQTKNSLNNTATALDEWKKLTEAATTETDIFGQVFTSLRGVGESYFDELAAGTMTIDEVKNKISEFTKTAVELNKDALAPDKQQQIFEYGQKYEKLFEVLDKYSKAKVIPPFDAKQWEKALIDLALFEEKLKIDPFERSPEELAKARVNAQKQFDDVKNTFLEAFVKLNQNTKQFQKLADESQEEYLKRVRESGDETFKALQNVGDEIVNFEGQVEVNIDTINKLNDAIKNLRTEAVKGFIVQNIPTLTSFYDIDFTNIQASRQRLLELEEQIASRRFDIEKKFSNDVEFLNYQLSQEIPEFAKLTYEQKLLVLREYLKKEVEETEEAEKTKQEKYAETLQFIQDTIGQLQAALGAIQATTSDFFNLQFDQLEKRYQRIQESLVEDTEENNAKRIEAEKIYNAEKARLEKQAAKTELRLTLAQTIANAASAVVAALEAGPIIGQILAGIVAAASAAQVGIVVSQINAVDSYQKGGRLKPFATGGLVKGPAHEYGGVKYQGGGIELEGNESIINRVSTVRYQDLLNQINLNGGGAPIINNFDDSRIVEAIATQRREPIRAYVVESDITSKQNIQRRLELLSQI